MEDYCGRVGGVRGMRRLTAAIAESRRRRASALNRSAGLDETNRARSTPMKDREVQAGRRSMEQARGVSGGSTNLGATRKGEYEQEVLMQ